MVVALAGIAIMLTAGVIDIFGLGGWKLFGRLQTVALIVGALMAVVGLFMNPRLREKIASRFFFVIQIFIGTFITMLSIFPSLVFPRTSPGFGVLKISCLLSGGCIIGYGIRNFIRVKRVRREEELNEIIESVDVPKNHKRDLGTC